MDISVQLDGVNPFIQETVVTSATTGFSPFSVPPVMSAPALSPAALLTIAHQVGEGLKSRSAGLDYHVDMINGTPRIRIIDNQTMQIIRQIPSDEVLTVHRAMSGTGGFLIQQNV